MYIGFSLEHSRFELIKKKIRYFVSKPKEIKI